MLCPRCNFDAPTGLRYCPACSNDLAPTPYPASGPPSGAYLQIPLPPSGAYPQIPLPPSGAYPQVPIQPPGPYPQVPLAPPGAYPPVSAMPVSGVPQPQPRRTLTILLACLGVVAILALGAVVALHFADQSGSDVSTGPAQTGGAHSGSAGSGEPTSGNTSGRIGTGPSADAEALAHGQAVGLDQLLQSAMNSRGQLKTALAQVQACSGLGDAVSRINQVVSDRQLQLQQADQLDLGALADGPTLHQTLADAWSLSLRADQAYGRWVQWLVQANRCHGSPAGNGDKTAAEDYSNQSHAPKDQFLAVWNPVAVHFGLTTRTQADV